MKQNRFFSILLFALISLWTISCNENSGNGVDNGDSTPIDVSQEVVSAENVFVYVPSPIETASLLKDAGAKYNPDLPNTPSNLSKYSSTASRALNLGVYGTDLAFAGIFEQHAETMLFLDCTGKLADALRVSAAFSADRNARLQNNMNNRDTVLGIITDSYWDCDALFHENHQPQASALMIAGGWVEGLYLACKVAESTNSNEIRIRIAEQGSSLDKLVALLDKQNHVDTKPLAAQLKDLKLIYDALPKTSNASPSVSTDNKTGVTTIGEDQAIPQLSLNALEFKHILDQISIIRTGIINRN